MSEKFTMGNNGAGAPDAPLVSVVISSYNYERFLPQAVESALGQTYPNVEVVVVDDGSGDGSRGVIESYGDRVVAVFKENGGQASACNAGFRASTGEVVIFLDADDVLLPETAGRVVRAFGSRPGVAKVQYRQRVVDADGISKGALQPPATVRMISGDLRHRMLEFNGYPWPSTSGNAFAASVLRQILPIPEEVYRGIPDIHLCNLSALLGPVVSLDEAGVLYRVHGDNSYYGSVNPSNVAQIRRTLVAVADSHARQKVLFNQLYGVDARHVGTRDLYFLSNRVLSLKLDAANHPFDDDTLSSMCARGCALSVSHPDPELYKYVRLLYFLWFVAMFFAPKRSAWSLAEMFYYREKRGRLFNAIFPLLQKIR